MKTHSTTSIRLLRLLGLLLIFVLFGAAAGIQQASAAEPPPQPTPTDVPNFEGVGSGLTPVGVQSGTVEGGPPQGVDKYSGCVFVWDVWTEDNSGIAGTFEPEDWIYLYMYVDNECYPFVSPNTLFWWQLWSPGDVSQLSHQEYFYVPTGAGQYWWEGQFTATPPMGTWTYKGTTSYYGGTNFDTTTFKVVPKAPTGVSATDGTYTDKVRISWTASHGATSYKVYRATTSGGSGSLIGSPAGTSFDDTTATPGTTYYYTVRGCVSVGCGSYSYQNSGWRAVGPTIPPTPTGVSASDGTYTDRVRVSWSSSSGATYYKVFRNTSNTTSGVTTLASHDVASPYDDTSATPGTTYYYWVKACNSAGCSGYSSSNSGWRASTGPTGPTFSDVPSSHWAYSYIEAIAKAGLTSGYPDGTYRPENRVTRAEMAVFLLNGMGVTAPPTNGSHPFTDIGGHWAEQFIEELFDQGITGGYPDGTYRPQNLVTRAEMAVFILKGVGVTPPAPNGSHPFSDVTGHWAEIFIEELYDQAITGGYPDGTYRPENRVTRAEMAVFLVNAFGLPLP